MLRDEQAYAWLIYKIECRMHTREFMYQKMDDSRNEVIQEVTKNKYD